MILNFLNRDKKYPNYGYLKSFLEEIKEHCFNIKELQSLLSSISSDDESYLLLQNEIEKNYSEM